MNKKSQDKDKNKNKNNASGNNKMIRHTGRIVAGAYYDFQGIRKSTMNRVRDIIRKKAEGIPFDAVEEEKEEKDYDSKYKDAELLTRLEEVKDQLTQKEYQYMRDVLEAAVETRKMEDTYKKLMESYVQSELIFQEFLKYIKGIGPVLSANLIKEFGYCETYEHVSSLWKHCGYHVVNGHSPRLRKGENIEFNPRLRTLAWKIGDSLMTTRSPLYRQIYEKEKKHHIKRMKNSTCKYCGKKTEEHYQDGDSHYCTKEKKQKVTLKDFRVKNMDIAENATPPWRRLHAHNRAIRKIAKLFLEHYWVATHDITGQDAGKPWVIDHGGHDDGGYIHWTEAVKANIEAKEKEEGKEGN